MPMMPISAEKIAENWEKFCAWFDKAGDRGAACKALCEHFGERLALCPASSKKSFHNCFPGGLVDHSLRVLKLAVNLKKTYDWQDVSNDGLIICSLFHDIGKVGDLDRDYYVEQKSDWHRDKLGELYTPNEALAYMDTPDRSVWLMQHFGIRLSREEWLAIKLNDGYVIEQNRKYCLKDGRLPVLIHQADLVATLTEKNDGS